LEQRIGVIVYSPMASGLLSGGTTALPQSPAGRKAPRHRSTLQRDARRGSHRVDSTQSRCHRSDRRHSKRPPGKRYCRRRRHQTQRRGHVGHRAGIGEAGSVSWKP
jgi:hypothetical protein